MRAERSARSSICSIFIILFADSGYADAALRPPTLADMLNLEGVGAAEISPDGRLVLFEREPPYRERSNFGTDPFWFDHSPVGAIYVYDVASGVQPRPLLPKGLLPAGIEGMWLAGFSPSGVRLAVNWSQAGAVHAGIYDFRTQSLRTLQITPDIPAVILGRGGPIEPIWLSDDELIYRVLPEGHQPVEPNYRREMGRQFSRLWEASWRGEQPTVSVSRTRSGAAERKMQEGSLVRVDATTGELHTIAQGRFFDFALSRDKRYLTALQRGEVSQIDPKAEADSTANLRIYRFEPVLIDLQGNEPIRYLSGFNVAEQSVRWSPKSDRFSFFAWREGTPRKSGQFYIYDVSNRACQAVPHKGLNLIEQSSIAEPPYLAVPVGSGLVLPAEAQADPAGEPAFPVSISKTNYTPSVSRIDWYWLSPEGARRKLTGTQRQVSPKQVAFAPGGVVIEADGALWLLDLQDEEPVPFTPKFKRKLANARAVGSWIVADVTDASALAFIDTQTGEVRSLSTKGAKGNLAAIHPAEHVAVFHRTSTGADKDGGPATPGLLSAVSDKGVHRIWEYSKLLSEILVPHNVRVGYTASDGKEAVVRVELPADWKPGKAAPGVVFVYPGVGGESFQMPSHHSIELLTTWGYAVIYPEKSLEAYEFHLTRADKDPLGGWAEVTLPAIDAVVRAGYVDSTRVGGYGISQGSSSIMALIEQTDRLKAAVCGYGLMDMVSSYGGLPLQYHIFPNDLFQTGFADRLENGYPTFGAAPWQDPAAYLRSDPIFGVHKIKTPLLLIQSDLDSQPLGQADEIYSAMVLLRKDAQYVRYWGEGHGTYSPANARDQWSRLLAWYDEYLDVSRNEKGEVLYERNQPKSRGAASPWAPADFLKFDGFFGH